MSRASISASRPRRGGTYRPQLEALEDRLAPGSLLGVDGGPLIDPDNSVAVRQREVVKLADLAGIIANQQQAAFHVSTSPAAELTDVAGIVANQQQAAFHVSTSPVVAFDDPSIVYGESILVRTDESVTIIGWTYGLEPGAYTAWLAAINPGATTPTVGWVAGLVVGPSGFAGFGAHVNEGEVLLGHPVFSGGSLQDAMGAEIRLVLRYHGPVDPERLFEQTHTFEPDVAVDAQRTIHLPPAAP